MSSGRSNLPFPTGISMVCSPPEPLPTPSCFSWLAGMVKTVCWELEPPEWIFSMPADQTQDVLHEAEADTDDGKHGCLCVPDRVVPVLPPPAANEAVVTSDVPLPLGTLTRVLAPAPLDMLTTGTLVTPLTTVPAAPTVPTAPLAVAAELAVPLTKVATAAFERAPPGAALALLAALMTAAWLAATNSEWCGEAGFPASTACWETQLSIKLKTGRIFSGDDNQKESEAHRFLFTVFAAFLFLLEGDLEYFLKPEQAMTFSCFNMFSDTCCIF